MNGGLRQHVLLDQDAYPDLQNDMLVDRTSQRSTRRETARYAGAEVGSTLGVIFARQRLYTLRAEGRRLQQPTFDLLQQHLRRNPKQVKKGVIRNQCAAARNPLLRERTNESHSCVGLLGHLLDCDDDMVPSPLHDYTEASLPELPGGV